MTVAALNNVISFPPAHPATAALAGSATPPVIVDFAEASRPHGEIALRLAADAAAQTAKLAATHDRKAGTLRILADGRSDLFEINPYLISIKEGWNSRDLTDPANHEHIDDIARSIAHEGVKQPLTVTLEGEKCIVTDGHCRLLATFRAITVYGAEIKAVRVIAESRYAKEDDRVFSQIVRNGGKKFTALELGAVFVKLTAFGWSPEQIAERGGLSTDTVKRSLELMADGNAGIRSLVATGQVSVTLATNTLRQHHGNVQMAERVLHNAVVVAKSAGKEKATLKHVKAGEVTAKLSTKDVLREVFEARTTSVEVGARTTQITLSTADWQTIVSRLALKS